MRDLSVGRPHKQGQCSTKAVFRLVRHTPHSGVKTLWLPHGTSRCGTQPGDRWRTRWQYGTTVEIMTGAGPAHVDLDQPEQRQPAFLAVLTHGAGGTPDTRDVLAVRDVARAAGAVTALVTQPYRVKGARAPGSAARQDAAWIEIIGALRAETPGVPLVQGGRSNGARVVCRTAADVSAVGVIALAFPLHPPGQPEKSRDAELRQAGTSVLVVNGDRDPFGVPEPDATTRGRRHRRGDPRPRKTPRGDWRGRRAMAGRTPRPIVIRLLLSAEVRRLAPDDRSGGAARSSRRLAVVLRCPRR